MVDLTQYISRKMTTKQFKKIDKKGHEEVWEWEETPEVISAIAALHRPREVVITEFNG